MITTEKSSEEPETSPPADKDTFKIYYFQGNCRAMISRAILSTSKAKYADITLDIENWKKDKADPKFEYGKLPLLEYKDDTINSTIPVQYYLAKTFNLCGTNDEEECKILSLFLTFESLLHYIHEVMSPKNINPNEESKKEYHENTKKFIKHFERYVVKYEKMYNHNGNGDYFFKDGFSVADIFFSVVLNYFSDILELEENINTNGPNVWKLANKIKSNELKEFFAKDYHPGIC